MTSLFQSTPLADLEAGLVYYEETYADGLLAEPDSSDRAAHREWEHAMYVTLLNLESLETSIAMVGEGQRVWWTEVNSPMVEPRGA